MWVMSFLEVVIGFMIKWQLLLFVKFPCLERLLLINIYRVTQRTCLIVLGNLSYTKDMLLNNILREYFTIFTTTPS